MPSLSKWFGSHRIERVMTSGSFFRLTSYLLPLTSMLLLCSCAGQSSLKNGGVSEQQSRQVAAARAFQEGLTEYQNGQLRPAIEAWNRSLLLNPDDATTHQYIGRAMQERDRRITSGLQEADELVGKQHWRDAMQKWEGVLELAPDHPEATRRRDSIQTELRVLYGKGMLDYQRGEVVEAIRAWEELLLKDPLYSGVKGDLEKARVIARQQGKKGELSGQYFADGMAAYKMGKLSEALGWWSKALEVDPQHVETRKIRDEVIKQKSQKAQEFFGKNQFEPAIILWKEALQIDPANLEVSQLIIRAQTMFEERVNKPYQDGIRAYNRGQYLEAIQKWRQALDIDPTYEEMKIYMVKATLGQGILYYRDERLDEAIGMWESTLKLAPEDPKAALYMRRAKAKQAALKKLGGK